MLKQYALPQAQVPLGGTAQGTIARRQPTSKQSKEEVESLLRESRYTFDKAGRQATEKAAFKQALEKLIGVAKADKPFPLADVIYTVENAYLVGRYPKADFEGEAV